MYYLNIPAFEANQKLLHLLADAKQHLNCQIIVVNDGSSPHTRPIFKKTSQMEVGRAMSSNPQTAIGIIDENHYTIVVSDSRTSESEGLALYQLAAVMKQYRVTTPYNLDGGGSSTLYFNGQSINKPTTNDNAISEGAVSDIIYIGY